MEFLSIFVFIVVGFTAQQFIKSSDALALRLNIAVIQLILPAVVLSSLSTLSVDLEMLFPMAASWAASALAALFIIALSKQLQFSKEVTGCLLLVGVLGNTSYLGFPVIRSLYSDEGQAYAVIFDQLGNFVLLAVYGTAVCALMSDSEERVTLARVGRKILTFPPFVALAVVLVLKVSVDDVFTRMSSIVKLSDYIALCLTPLTMFIIGLQFKLTVSQSYRKPLVVALLGKMLLSPLIVIGLASLLGATGLIYKVSVVEAGMPAMVSAAALAIHAGLAPKLAASVVTVGLIVSALTLPLWYFIAEALF